MTRKTRPYLFYDTTTSLCATCLGRVEAKILLREDRVVLEKWCPAHGVARVTISDDPAYYRLGREVYLKRPELPARFATEMRWGCPYDCGLCPDHMQHSCLTVVEITDHCNLRCPACYAGSGPERAGYRDLATVTRMLDAVVASEGAPDVVQLSGGEPTLHPELFAILDAARARPIKHLMINTNGLRLAREPGFVARLAAYAPGLEIYLQCDSLRDEALERLRGARLARVHEEALAQLEAHGLSTTLVMTVERGVNDRDIGEVIGWAQGFRCVRGVTLQPLSRVGRHELAPAEPLTVSELRREVAAQSGLFTLDDLVPVPCNPDTLAMAYALKTDSGVRPLTRFLGPEALLAGDRSTIVFERDPELKARVFQLFSTGHAAEGQARELRELLCCLPRIEALPALSYENVFRVLIVQFMDARNMDLRALKRSCVHMVQPDGRMIPFEAHNLFYRQGQEARLDRLRREVDVGTRARRLPLAETGG